MRLPSILLKEIHDGHCSDHFSKTGYFSNSMNSFAIVIHVFIIFTFPNAPAFGRNLWNTLIVTKELQKISKIL